MTAKEWVDLLIHKAPALRDAGIRHLEIEGVIVDLAPPMPEFEPDKDEDFDPLYGGPVPTRRVSDA